MRAWVCSLLFGLLTTSSAFGQQPAKPSLSLSCAAEKSSYKPREIVSLTITLENRGSSDVYLFGTLEWGWAGIFYRLIDATGHTVNPRKPFPIPPPPPPIYDKSALVGLSPRYFYGTHISFDLNYYDPKPGVYFIQVAYHSSYHSSNGFGLPILTWEDGKVLSNKVEIQILPN
jgi:hypothetical protein